MHCRSWRDHSCRKRGSIYKAVEINFQDSSFTFVDRDVARQRAGVELDGVGVVVNGVDTWSYGVRLKQAGLGVDAELRLFPAASRIVGIWNRGPGTEHTHDR